MPKGFEIEKKYLIERPDPQFLREKGAREKSIVQTYLSAPAGVSERVRKTVCDGATVYTHTVKTKVSGITRREDEETVDEATYNALCRRADPDCAEIRKTRFVLRGEKHVYEFDVFPFWEDKAFLEVELEREDEEVFLPDFVRIIEDVSTNKAYTNHALSKRLKAKL